MKFIFHKLSKKYPNTINGLRDSIKLGHTKFEFDIRECRDKTIVYHDSSINNRPIKNLKHIDIPHINSLDDFLEEFNRYSNLEIYFDIKGSNINCVKKIIDKLDQSKNTNKFFFQSFNRDFLTYLKAANSSLVCGLIVSGYPINLKDNLSNIDYLVIEEEFIDKYLHINIDKYIYTVNSLDDLLHYRKIGLKGIFTDYPEKFLESNDL
jgi:glycerophosphoryl diester phosphodiesterase